MTAATLLATARLTVALLFGFPVSSLAQSDIPPAAIPSLSWQSVAVMGGGVVMLSLLDGSTARHFEGQGQSDLLRDLNRFGEVSVIAPVTLGLLAAGLLADSPALTRTSGQVIGALLVSTVATQSLKYAIGRSRPHDDPALAGGTVRPFSGHQAMPSGHTAAAFAFATVLGDEIDRPLPRIGLYLLAGATGYARVAGSRHWGSDVLAGAAVGFVSARLASGRLAVLGIRAPQFMIGPDRLGITADF